MRSHALFAVLAVMLGLGLRGYHYLRGPFVWHDEAAVIVNVLQKDYASLLGPLDLHQAAPPLFLWVEKAVSQTLGDGPYALRLPSFVVSCISMILFLPIARRFLPPRAVPWAVFLFACSESLSFHAFEVKPYTFDVFAAILLIWIYICRERLGLPRLLLAYTVAVPPLLWLSYPSCFVAGGIIAALTPVVWQDRRPRTVGAFSLLILATAAAFLALALGPVKVQNQDTGLTSCWTTFYPNWQKPWTVPLWLATSTLDLGRYVCKPSGLVLMVLAIAGGVLLWRSGRRTDLAVLAMPVGLTLLAACLHRYPYGGGRITLFAAPAVFLLAARALDPLLEWARSRHRLAPAALLLLLLVPPAAGAAQRTVRPWAVADSRSAAEFVESRRLPEDPVAGNDWSHLYYFRKLGHSFRGPDGPAHPLGNRLWVVWTQQSPPEVRVQAAAMQVPPGWQAVERYDSLFTTAVLFVPGAE